MNLLFLSLAKIDSFNKSHIYTDLLREFCRQGHNIYAVSPVEKRYTAGTTLINDEFGTILKVKTGNITKCNLIEKGISTLRIENQFIHAIKKYLKNVHFDLVLYSTPPITFAKVINFIKKRDCARSYLLLKDIFPQNAVDLDIFGKQSPIYTFFRRKEKELYALSDYIGCMSQANVDYVIRHNPEINPDKIEVCPNSIELKDIQMTEDDKQKIRLKYQIPMDRMVFVYGGNLGKPQGIDHIMRCLEACRDMDKAFFLIVGSGTEFDRLESYIKRKAFKNVKILSQMPKEDYEQLANSCDVGLIFLDYRFTIPNFPSRLLSYMQASMPVLASTDKNTDIGKVIEKGNFGYWCESIKSEAFKERVERFINAPTKNLIMGENARNYLEENYTVEKAYDIIMKHFGE